MAGLKWPPEDTFRYIFSDELELGIPVYENDEKDKKKRSHQKKVEDGREI